MFQVLFFFHNFLQSSLQKSFQFVFYKFRKIKSFECPKSVRNYKQIMLGTSDTWQTSHLFKRTSVLYCKLSDLLSGQTDNQLPPHIRILFFWQPQIFSPFNINDNRLSISHSVLFSEFPNF